MVTNDDEIDLDTDEIDDCTEEEETTVLRFQNKTIAEPHPTNSGSSDNADIKGREQEVEEGIGNDRTKRSAIQERMRKLRMKMNQSRQLNKKEVIAEGERIGNDEAAYRNKKNMHRFERERKEKEWQRVNAKALSLNSNQATTKTDATYLPKETTLMAQMACDSLRQSQKKLDTKERGQYADNDYYNPEGQFCNYERSLKSIPSSRRHSSISAEEGSMEYIKQKQIEEREGAKLLASELNRRAQKSEKSKRKAMEIEATDVNYINERNKRFNQKIGRNYDKHTVEIRQNLERGTAL